MIQKAEPYSNVSFVLNTLGSETKRLDSMHEANIIKHFQKLIEYCKILYFPLLWDIQINVLKIHGIINK